MEEGEPGALSLYHAASPDEHLEYSQQITAEVQKLEFISGRGEVTVWDRVRRNNHYLDAGYLSLAAGDFMLRELERLQTNEVHSGWMAAQSRKRTQRRVMV